MKSYLVAILGLSALFSVIASESQANPGYCYGRHGHTVCQGSVIHFKNNSGEHREGKAAEVFSDGTVRVLYNYNGGQNELYRDATQVAVATTCSGSICNGQDVHLLNNSREDRNGQAERTFADGWVRVTYRYNGGLNELWRRASELARKVSCYQSACTGARVHFKNNSGEDRVGNIVDIFANGRARIQYRYNGGLNELWRNVGNVASSTTCAVVR